MAVPTPTAYATKANSLVVQIKPSDFERILADASEPLVVHTRGGVFAPNHQYLTSYKGLTFLCRSPTRMDMPSGVQVISASSILSIN